MPVYVCNLTGLCMSIKIIAQILPVIDANQGFTGDFEWKIANAAGDGFEDRLVGYV